MTVTPSDPYLDHVDGYLELVEDDSSLFHDIPVPVPTPEQEPISPELLWYFSRHPKEQDNLKPTLEGLPDPPSVPRAGGHTTDIERVARH